MGLLRDVFGNDVLDTSKNWKTDYVTRSGAEAEILAVDNGAAQPIVFRYKVRGGVAAGDWKVWLATPSGRIVESDYYPEDLMMRPNKVVPRRLLLLSSGTVRCLPPESDYDAKGVIGSALVEIHEGQFDRTFDDGQPF